MPAYDYQCLTCGTINEVIHSIKDDALKQNHCPVCENVQPCSRKIVRNLCGVIFKGEGWTMKSSGFGARGYKGKFQDKVRPVGTPVDAPSDKRESDMQFQKYIDSGGLDGIKPTFDFNDKQDPRRPQTAQEQVDKGASHKKIQIN
ncbi:MAG TPA: zinc ribbon domain-containing protein [Bacillota bacterium]|nr:zinc ribbon domain-containing protein [Bacillota bacterium]